MINKLYRIYYYFADYLYDAYRYLVHSTTISANSFQRLEGRLMANAHAIERGLSFEKPGNKFAIDIIKTLLSLVHNYIDRQYTSDNFAFQSAKQALRDYLEFHKKKGISLGVLEDQIINLSIDKSDLIESSTISLHTKEYFKNSSFADTIIKRRSVRNFLNTPVSLRKIKYAIKLALNSPSVCNRQSWHIYILKKGDTLNHVLNLQRGNRGFREKIGTLLVVTADLNSFQGFNERNQGFIDGGIFSMSLLLSLHYADLGACPMNWSYHFDEDLKIRKVLKVRRSENIILFIAVGNVPPEVDVPRSRKKDISDTVSLLK